MKFIKLQTPPYQLSDGLWGTKETMNIELIKSTDIIKAYVFHVDGNGRQAYVNVDFYDHVTKRVINFCYYPKNGVQENYVNLDLALTWLNQLQKELNEEKY